MLWNTLIENIKKKKEKEISERKLLETIHINNNSLKELLSIQNHVT